METAAALTRRTRIAIIGSGNVATHMAVALDRVADVVQVYSRNAGHAARLASQLRDAVATDSPDRLRRDLDVYLIAVSDDAIGRVVADTPDCPGIWAHTSGSVPMTALASKSRHGVFYPLQTFSRTAPVDMSCVPLLTEGSDPDVECRLESLARQLTPRVSHADSDMRRRLHVAAVYACNFANYMWTLADDLLRRDGHDITIFEALLRATLDKALVAGPEPAQTGPARRGDKAVIDSHIASLPAGKAEVYRLLTTQIMQRYEQDKL